MKLNLRNANIGGAVGTIILFAGVYLFRHASEGALQIVLLVSWVAMFGTAGILNARDERRENRSQ